MNGIKLGETIVIGFTTHRFDTGAASNADSLPTCTVYENNTGTVGGTTVTNLATGVYYVTIVATSGNGYEAGKFYNVSIAATVSGISGNAIIDTFVVRDASIDDVKTQTAAIEVDTQDIQNRLPAALTAGGNIKADAIAISGDTVAADNLEAAADGTGYNLGAGQVVAASVTGAVGSVAGNVGGNVVGSVASVTAAVTVGTNNDKTGYGLSAAAVQAIWDALTAALTTAGSIGKRLVDNITGDAFARLGAPAGASVSADVAAVKSDTAAVKTKTDQLTFTTANKVDSTIQAAGDFAQAAADKVWASAARTLTSFGALVSDIWANVTRTLTAGAAPSAADVADAVCDEALSGHMTAGSVGEALNRLDEIQAKTDTLGGAAVTLTQPVADDGTISIFPGDAYTTTHARQIDVTISGAPTLVGASVNLVIWDGNKIVITVAGAVIVAGAGDQQVRFQPTAAQTDDLTRIGTTAYRYQIQATWAADAPAQPAVIAEGDVNTDRRFQ